MVFQIKISNIVLSYNLWQFIPNRSLFLILKILSFFFSNLILDSFNCYYLLGNTIFRKLNSLALKSSINPLNRNRITKNFQS